MPARAYPFPRLFSEVALAVTSIRVDGDQLPDYNVDAESRTIALYASGRSNWREAELFVRVEVPLQELKVKGLDDAATHVLVRMNCARTNLRSGQLLALKNGVAEVRLSMRKEHVIDKATLEGFVIRDAEDGFARILREAEPWEISFSESQSQSNLPRPSRPGGLRQFIDISWQDFRDPQVISGALTPFAREAYFFDVEAETPTLYLNRGIEGYHSLLAAHDAASGSRTENVFRELEFKRVSLGVWLALCFEAISCIVEDENRELAIPDGWRGEILKLILPRIFPGESLDSAYQKVVALRRESGTSAFVLGRLQVAVNEQISTSTTLKKHLMALLREGSA